MLFLKWPIVTSRSINTSWKIEVAGTSIFTLYSFRYLHLLSLLCLRFLCIILFFLLGRHLLCVGRNDYFQEILTLCRWNGDLLIRSDYLQRLWHLSRWIHRPLIRSNYLKWLCNPNRWTQGPPFGRNLFQGLWIMSRGIRRLFLWLSQWLTRGIAKCSFYDLANGFTEGKVED